MNECPICGQVCGSLDYLADHILRAHHDRLMGDPPRQLVPASYQRHRFAGFFCWCGEGVEVILGDDGREAFLQHCTEKGGLVPHLLGLMLGVSGDG